MHTSREFPFAFPPLVENGIDGGIKWACLCCLFASRDGVELSGLPFTEGLCFLVRRASGEEE
jgi:hypothetical protein